MAKQLNKKLVVILTIIGMVVTTAAGVVMLNLLPQRDPEQYALQAEKLVADGQYEAAVRAYERAFRLARGSDHTRGKANEYLILAGEAALKGGAASDAFQYWRRAMLNNPNDERALEQITLLQLEIAELVQRGRVWSELQEFAGRLKTANPENYVGLHALGRSLIEQRSVNEAFLEEGRQYLEQAFQGDKSNPRYARSLSRYYLFVDQADEAEDVFNTLIANPSSDPAEVVAAYRSRGEFYNMKKQRAQAEYRERQLERAGQQELARIREEIRDADEKALADLTEAVRRAEELDTPDVDSLIALGEYWHRKRPTTSEDAEAAEEEIRRFRERARQYYEQAIDKDPDHFIPYAVLAQLYREERRFADAARVLDARLERGFRRDHYLGWRDRLYMDVLRNMAFTALMDKATTLDQEIEDPEARRKEYRATLARMRDLYNQSRAEAASGEQDPGVLFMEGRLLLLEENFDRAVQVLTRADTLTPMSDPNVKRTLALAYLELNAPDMARRQLEQIAMRDDPTDVRAWNLLAAVRLQLNMHDEAIQAADMALRLAPGLRPALLTKRAALMAQGDFKGVNDIDRLIGLEAEGSAASRVQQAMNMRIRAAQSDPPDASLLAEAERLLRGALEQQPLNLNAINQLVTLIEPQEESQPRIARILDDATRLAEERMAEEGPVGERADGTAINYLEILRGLEMLRIIADPATEEAEKVAQAEKLIQQREDPYRVAVELFQVYQRAQGREEDAYRQLIRAHELRPEEGAIIEMLFALAIDRQDWQRAEQLVDQAIKLGLDRSGGALYRGRLLLANASIENNVSKAIEQFRTAVRHLPNDQQSHAHLGRALLMSRNYEDAKQSFLKVRSMNSLNAAAALGLLQIASTQGDVEEQERYLAICESLAPEHPLVRQMVQQRADRADPRQGIARRERLREQNPNDHVNLIQLAGLYGQVGDDARAKEAYEAAQQLHPDNLQVVTSYAQFLRTKQPPEMAKAEQVLRDLLGRLDGNQGREKAAAQLALAIHLRAARQQGGEGAPSLAEVDDAFVAASRISPDAVVRMDISNHFIHTRRFDEAEQWLRQTIEASMKEQNRELEKRARENLVRTLIGSMDSAREGGILKEIDAYRVRFPDDALTLLLTAEFHAAHGRDAEAMDYYTEYIQRVPEPTVAYYRRGTLQLRGSHWAEAIRDFREVKRIDPGFGDYRPRILLAMALEENRQPEAAIDELQSILNEDPDNPAAIRGMFAILLSLERWDRAQSLAERRAAAQPENPLWQSYLAQIASGQNQADRAIRMALNAFELSDADPRARDDLLNIYLKFQRYGELIAFVENQIPTDQRTALVRMRMGSAHAGLRDAARAIDLYLAAFEAPDFHPDMLDGSLRDDLQRRLGLEAALTAIRQRLGDSPADARLRLMLGIVQHAKGDAERTGGRETSATQNLETSMETLQALLDDTPETEDQLELRNYLNKKLGMVASELNRPEQSREYYEAAVALKPDDVQTLNNLAFVLMDQLDDPETSLPYARRAVDLMPNRYQVLDTLGWNLVLLGNYDEGIRYLRQAIGEDGGSVAEIHYHLAVAFHQRSIEPNNPRADLDRRDAVAECRRAHQLIMDSGRDPLNLLPRVCDLGDELELRLMRRFGPG